MNDHSWLLVHFVPVALMLIKEIQIVVFVIAHFTIQITVCDCMIMFIYFMQVKVNVQFYIIDDAKEMITISPKIIKHTHTHQKEIPDQ